jgi:acyl carrier protein
MDKEQVKEQLKSLIEDVMPDLEEVKLDTDMKQEYGVNSVSLIRLIVACEETFAVEFTDYELDLDSYDTFGDLAASITEKLAKKDA